MTAKERLHRLVDELPDQEAEVALVILERRRDDPMLGVLAAAPVDDEPSTPEEDADAAEALASHGGGESSARMALRQLDRLFTDETTQDSTAAISSERDAR